MDIDVAPSCQLHIRLANTTESPTSDTDPLRHAQVLFYSHP